MRITKKLVAETCLPVYYEVIKKGNKMNEDLFLCLLEQNGCELGICRLFEHITSVGLTSFKPLIIISNKWLSGNIGGKYYYKTAKYSYNKKEMLECIQVRIDLLESWLK